jgi:surfactin synthase thioesterase subunit
LHKLPDDRLVERLRTYNGTPAILLESPDLLRIFLPTLRADLSLVETYVYAPAEPLDCGISAFGASEDAGVEPEVVAPWGEQTRGPFYHRTFLGDHFYLLGDRGREELLACIAADLDRVLD